MYSTADCFVFKSTVVLEISNLVLEIRLHCNLLYLKTSVVKLATDKTLDFYYSRPSVIRTSIIRTLDYPNSEADENYWFKVQEIIITSSFIIISARAMYTFINFVSIHDS